MGALTKCGRYLVAFLIFFPLGVYSEVSTLKIRATYNSLDPLSIAQHLAFYELYPETEYGKKALNEAWQLIGKRPAESGWIGRAAFDHSVHAIIALINQQPDQKASQLDETTLRFIEEAASTLENRKLKGYYAKTEAEILALPPEQIDLAHAIFLSQENRESEALHTHKSYEAAIDLMALQIRVRLPKNASPGQKIHTINDFIFHELGFRFPPQSLYAKEIDRYTYLSSVIDSRRGICLGVSVLYLALAQRLGLSLEIVTPPGHIYVRYRGEDTIINIETTARGIDVDSEEYLSISTYALEKRNIKETVGLIHFNQAADDLRAANFSKAVVAYQKAKLYIADDRFLDELLGICQILCGSTAEGAAALAKIVQTPSKYIIGKNITCEDYLSGNANHDALKALFMHVDDDRDSILQHQKTLQNVLSNCPKFRAGILAYAMCWIQLHRFGEAVEWLEKYHQMDPSDPKVEYYLAVLYGERYNFPKAWEHLKNAEALTKSKNHFPKALKEFRDALSQRSPN